jgi:hypothetical protein
MASGGISSIYDFVDVSSGWMSLCNFHKAVCKALIFPRGSRSRIVKEARAARISALRSIVKAIMLTHNNVGRQAAKG